MKRRAVLVGSALALSGCLGSGDDAPDRLDASGEIAVVIDGSPVDLTRDRFQSEHADDSSLAFHLHAGDEQWYMEGFDRVTVAEGIDLLPQFSYVREGDAHVLTVDGTTYDERDPGTEIGFQVDGETVDPTGYELRDGDSIRVGVTTGG